jgi:hypothetical protein
MEASVSTDEPALRDRPRHREATPGSTTMISKSGPGSMTPINAICTAAYKAIDAEQTTEMVEIPTSARARRPTRLIVTNARRHLRRSG